MLPTSSPSSLPSPRRPGAPKGNKNALGHGAPRGNRNGVGHGAPRGNTNALKFGIYTREFNRPLVQPPGMSLVEALELEIYRIRLFIRDDLLPLRPGRPDVRLQLSLLRAATIAAGRIQRLYRTIYTIQNSRAPQYDLDSLIARLNALHPAAEQEPVPGSASRLPPSPAGEPQVVQEATPPLGKQGQDNCLLVPLCSPERNNSPMSPRLQEDRTALRRSVRRKQVKIPV